MPSKREYVAYLLHKSAHTGDRNKWLVYGALAAWVDEFCPEDATDAQIINAGSECGEFLERVYGNSTYSRCANICMATLFNATDMKHVKHVTYNKPLPPLDTLFKTVVGLKKKELATAEG